MEIPMVMVMDPSLVKSETSEAGTPTAFKDSQALKSYGNVSIGWVSEDWKIAGGKPAGIGGDPSGATAEKGRIILRTSAKVLVSGLKGIRTWKGQRKYAFFVYSNKIMEGMGLVPSFLLYGISFT